jgi:uncharacterized membrane protein
MKTKFLAVMVICFVFGGYFILTFATQIYDFSVRGVMFEGANMTERLNQSNMTPFGARDFRGLPAARRFPSESFIDLIGGIMFIVAGITIWRLVSEEELDHLREELSDTFLLPEEKAVIGELKKAGGEITQRELVNRTGLGKVKIHRVLGKLESKDIVRRYPYGMTKKIVIEKRPRREPTALSEAPT